KFIPAISGTTVDQFNATIVPLSSHTLTVTSQGVTGVDGVTGKIVPDPSAPGAFDVTFTDPNATSGQMFNVKVTRTDGTTANTTTVGATDQLTPATTSATIDDFLAMIDLGDGLGVTLNSQGVSAVTGAAAQIVADPNSGYNVEVTSLGSPTTTTSTLSVPLPD